MSDIKVNGNHGTVIIIEQSNTSLLGSGPQTNLLSLGLTGIATGAGLAGNGNGNHYGQLKH